MVNVAIFDYGAGNIFSLKTSLEKNGASVDVITSFDQVKNHSGLLLPGVGNFDPAIRSIRDYSAIQFNDFVKDKVPVLGICLGMEMFFEKSEEGIEKGFNVINGEIVVLPSTMKVPHMGWNIVYQKKENPFFEGIGKAARFYFVHSYYVELSLDDQVNRLVTHPFTRVTISVISLAIQLSLSLALAHANNDFTQPHTF